MTKKLNSEEREIIKSLAKEGTLKISILTKITKSDYKDVILSVLCSLFNLTQEEKKTLWYHTIMKIWNEHDADTCFNEQDCIFFKKLVENKGFLKKTDCQKADVLSTDFKISRTAENLKDLGLIEIYSLSNRDVVYTLNLKYYEEVFNNGKDR